MKKLKNLIPLRSVVKIYVPSTFNVDQEIDNSKYVDDTITILSKCFGGATTSKALGAWVTSSGKIVKESVDICYSYCNQEKLDKYIDDIYDYCLSMRIELKQDSISLEINGELYFI